MFCKATLVTAALGLIVSATPIQNTNGVRIPIAARSSLTTEDGVFDHDKAILANVHTINKHRQNLINLEKNVGAHAFNLGAEIKPLARIPERLLAKRQSESLDDQQETEWSGPITIGTPAQKFVIDFDTGSSDLWVPSGDCTDDACSSKNKYKTSASSTTAKKDGNFTIKYGDGSSVSGPVFTDTVSVAGINVKDQYFSPVTTLSSMFGKDPIDGILGLAYPQISNLKQDPFFNAAIKQNAVKEKTFGFKLAKSGSELYLGGVNNKLFTDKLETHAVDSSSGFWQISGASISANKKSVASSFNTIIDSGTTIMYGPPDVVKQVYAAIDGTGVADADQGFYYFPCDKVPTISFNWGGKDWAISAENLNLGETKSGSGQCVGSLAAQDLGLGSDTWLLGDSFMKNVYTAFSFEDNTVGFAPLA